MENMLAYGLQLCFDGYGGDPAKLADVSHLYDLLMRLPKEIGMERVGFPHIIQIEKDPIRGLSGFVFIMESHIAIHTYSTKGFVTVDIYSCKTFDTKTATERLAEAFGVRDHEKRVLIRGRRFHAKGAKR